MDDDRYKFNLFNFESVKCSKIVLEWVNDNAIETWTTQEKADIIFNNPFLRVLTALKCGDFPSAYALLKSYVVPKNKLTQDIIDDLASKIEEANAPYPVDKTYDKDNALSDAIIYDGMYWDNVNKIVGIGTENPSFSLSPSKGLDVTYNGDGFPILKINRTGGSSKTNVSWEALISSDGNYLIRNATTGKSVFNIDYSCPVNSFVMDENGYIGYGTPYPKKTIHVHGSSLSGNGIQITNPDTGIASNNGFAFKLNAEKDVDIINYENADINFWTNNTQNIKIDSDGNLSMSADNSKTYYGLTDDFSITYDGDHARFNILTSGDFVFENGKIKAKDINFSNLPTSSAGLSTGDVWNDNGTLKIV